MLEEVKLIQNVLHERAKNVQKNPENKPFCSKESLKKNPFNHLVTRQIYVGNPWWCPDPQVLNHCSNERDTDP